MLSRQLKVCALGEKGERNFLLLGRYKSAQHSLIMQVALLSFHTQ
jgi:hypothetical protein